MHQAQSTGQAGKIEKEQTVSPKEKVHQGWSKCYGTKRSEELLAFKKMSICNSDQESISSISSEEGEVWKLGLGGFYNFNNDHSSKIFKQNKEFFFNWC